MYRIRITIKSDSNPGYHTEVIWTIDGYDYTVLKNVLFPAYDTVYDKLLDRIESEVIDLDPDWYIDTIKFN